MTDLEKIKHEVSIIQAATILGYKLNPEKGKKTPELTHPTLGNIIVYNPNDSARQRYFTRGDDLDKGSVVDFVKHRVGAFNIHSGRQGFGEVVDVLNSLAGGKVAQQIPINAPPDKKFNLEDYKVGPIQIKEMRYLSNERKIPPETLKVFQDSIMKESRGKFWNVAFPIRAPAEETIIGLEFRNKNFKRQADGSDRKNGLWIADPEKVGKEAKQVYISEAPIDAISFYHLHKNKLDLKEAVFVATCGTPSKSQIEALKSTFQQAKFSTAYDHDLAGEVFNIKTAAWLEGKEIAVRQKKEDPEIQVNLNKQTYRINKNDPTLFNSFRKSSGIGNSLTTYTPHTKDFNEDLQKGLMSRERIPYDQMKSIGISKADIDSLNQMEREAFLKGKSSPVMRLTIEKEGTTFSGHGKVSLYEKPCGEMDIKVHPVKLGVENNYSLSEQQFKQLKKGEIISHQANKNGFVKHFLLQADKQTNEVKYVDVSSLKLPERIQGYVLEEKEKELLKKGQRVEFQNLKGEHQSIKLDLIAPKGILVQQTSGADQNEISRSNASYLSR
ncbi:DUF4099 domain-containing protein [Persicobacter diffluens]|uniref:DUF3991 domain-containing protein n=1 Tax=Persicobacter diffluens TaxID=981 RepID=A0AAN4W5D3_9BACT|nr:hypothetical protein PEDI_51890 [Persicobacter diffluens]